VHGFVKRANTLHTLKETLTSANMQWVDAPITDGVYDAFVVWAETRTDDDVALDLTITTGAHKGEVLSMRAANVERDPLDLVGLPCTLVVERGNPRVEW
jgi:hypothetical protein